MNDPSMYGLISKLSRDMDSEGVVHALTGSIASSLHGEPITSIDVDIVLRMTPQTAVRLARCWERDLCADEESFRKAALEHGIANLLHFPSGLKVDISVLEDTPYHREVLSRRIKFVPPGHQDAFWVVTPEDIILMKLVWRKNSRSQKQWENALGVAKIKGHQLDWGYLRRWAEDLGVGDDLQQLMQEAGI